MLIDHVLQSLDGMTAAEAVEAGWEPREVWRCALCGVRTYHPPAADSSACRTSPIFCSTGVRLC